ncbi:hypothetical protein OSB04_023720 [Centaurea solstitialis]|uniref:Uncharacterized protein n=1 Tax=Centaurea solstitialis TaxID=347529 RepID=A0AA38T4C8_9ASTR|nr:hypothetical protein OSB04_023720 [Centaurea solstitialis]
MGPTSPVGIAVDVPVRVRDFVYPTDFLVPYLHEDPEVPIIFDKPFLYTSESVIDIRTQNTLSWARTPLRMKEKQKRRFSDDEAKLSLEEHEDFRVREIIFELSDSMNLRNRSTKPPYIR